MNALDDYDKMIGEDMPPLRDLAVNLLTKDVAILINYIDSCRSTGDNREMSREESIAYERIRRTIYK